MTTSNYDVLDLDSIENNPYCQHGPSILFSNDKKKFFSCSACRDHKLCNFYIDFDDTKLDEKLRKKFHDRYLLYQQETHENFKKNFEVLQSLKPDERVYCRTCDKFLIDDEHKDSDNHIVLKGIDNEMLKNPIRRILKPVELNTKNAQFLFDENTLNFIMDHVETFKYDSVLCIGTPSVFECLQESKGGRKKFLLDIDDRLTQFYTDREFAQHNMFNNHFFENRQDFDQFLGESKNLLICMDPPFGGIVKLIANTINQIKSAGKTSVFLIYPYFNECWISKWLPNFKMLDYKVSYENQKSFSQANTCVKKGSPARIFTNIEISLIELPVEHGYVYCGICEKFTYKENKHCHKCQKCTSKDGGVYKHCLKCKRCVKESYEHCEKCDLCHLKSLVNCKYETRGEKRRLSHEQKSQKDSIKIGKNKKQKKIKIKS